MDKIDDNDTDDYKEVSDRCSKKAWTRLSQKVYEVDFFICLKCGCEMKIIVIIQDKKVIKK